MQLNLLLVNLSDNIHIYKAIYNVIAQFTHLDFLCITTIILLFYPIIITWCSSNKDAVHAMAIEILLRLSAVVSEQYTVGETLNFSRLVVLIFYRNLHPYKAIN